MALSQAKVDLLQKLLNKPLTVIDLETEQNIAAVQDLVNTGYARDFAAHHGHRIPVRLRIWGITSAGKAVLEQQAMAEMSRGRQPPLTLFAKEPLKVPPKQALKKPNSSPTPSPTLSPNSSPTPSPTQEEREDKPPKEVSAKWFDKGDGGLIPRETRRLNARDGIEKDD